MTEDDTSPFDFPCHYPIKAMGRADADIEQTVWNIVTRHVTGITADALDTRSSRNGRFLSITITIVAENRSQLDAVYAELQAHPAILAAL